jgi:hypothetical protein
MHSFRLSQGQPDGQESITDLLSYEYAWRIPQEELEDAWPIVEAQVAALGIPGEHEPKEEKTIRDEFNRALSVFKSGLDKAYTDGPLSEEELATKARLAASRIMVEDEIWQSKPRPNRTGRNDPHASMLREYIIGNKLHASGPMMTVRDRMRDAVLLAKDRQPTDWPLSRQMHYFIPEWQQNHPTQSFWAD